MQAKDSRHRAMLGGLMGLCLLAGPVSAHHAAANYDHSKTVSVTGTVTRFQFINPHVGVWIDVEDEQGNVVEWSGEFQGILDLYRNFGWNRDTFKPGDKVTLIGNPARDGSHSMAAARVVFADGKEVDLRSAPD
jgi:Family of unknown function (DUF6152)